jgi:tetratricopeptide (TPR) repeat protein
VPLAAGRFDEALERIEEALALNLEFGDRFSRPLVGDPRTWVYRSRGDYGRALEAGREGFELALGVDHPEWTGFTGATLGWVLLDLQAADEAEAVLRPALAAIEPIGAGATVIRCAALLAWAERLRGNAARADELTSRAEGLLAGLTVPPGGAWLWGAHAQLALARVHLAAGRPERAEALARPLLHAAERSGWHETAALAAVVLGRCHEAAGDAAAARPHLERALATASAIGLPGAEWEARVALHGVLRAEGATIEATAEAERARAVVRRISAGLADDGLRTSFEHGALRELEYAID